MPPQQDLIFVHHHSHPSKKAARSHLAQTGINRRIAQQNQLQPHEPSKSPKLNFIPQSQPSIPPPVPLSGSSLVEYLTSTTIHQSLARTWGISPALCPGPLHLAHSLARTSPALECIFRANIAFHCIGLKFWDTREQRRNLLVAALSYRGDAIEAARRELCRYGAEEGEGLRNWESSFGVVLRLLQLDYRFSRGSVASHFGACRRLIRGDEIVQPTLSSIHALASTIRNPQLHHIMISFECANCARESIIWDEGDVPFFTGCLSEFTDRIHTARSRSRSRPLIPPSTILWRSLTKTPASEGSHIYRDVSEASVQLATIIMLCSVFLDYGGENDSSSIAGQCVEELEGALFALGEEDALSSALNVSWLLGGGLGVPVSGRRERLWVMSGMLFVLRKGLSEDAGLSAEDVRTICLEFLGGSFG